MQPSENELHRQKITKFWLLQALGWSPYFIVQLILFGSDDRLSADSLVYAASGTVIAILGSLVIRRAYRYMTEKHLGNGLWLTLLIILCILLSVSVDIIHQLFLYGLSQSAAGFSTIGDQQPLFAQSFLLFFAYLFWSGFYLVLTRQEKLNNALLYQKSMELLLKETQLSQLLEQLNPHFMFNTINNIRALILKDSDKARDMLTSFSDIMRYQINNDQEPLVALKDELTFVRDYIDLVRLQLGERLNYIEEIDKTLLGHKIPRMSLQLLVENAVKHGLGKSAKPGRLIITISRNDPDWFIKVSNDGHLDSSKSDSGVGLENLKNRLNLNFNGQYEFSIRPAGELVECLILFKNHLDIKND